MTTWTWIITHRRERLLKELGEISEYKELPRSEQIELSVERAVEHAKFISTPASKQNLSRLDDVITINDVIAEDLDKLMKFYEPMGLVEFKEFDHHFQWFLSLHNKIYQDISGQASLDH